MKNVGLLKRQKLTVEEHKELGKELCAMSGRLSALGIELYNRGYRAGIYEDCLKARQRISIVRCQLDDIFTIEHREEFDPKIYYPGGC